MTVRELLERKEEYSKITISKDCEIIFSDNIDELYEERRELLGMRVLEYDFDLQMVVNSRWYWNCRIWVE